MYRLVAIVGLPGAGKSAAVAEFEAAGYGKVYFGGITLDKLAEAGLEINEVNERMMREKLRVDHGMAAYALLSIPKIEAGLKTGNIVADGLYSWEEYLILKEKFPFMEMVAIWAPPKVRYERLANRPVRPLTKAEVQSREKSQIENLNQGGPIVMADALIVNTGTESELKQALKGIINGQ